jgi:hypothetical protein
MRPGSLRPGATHGRWSVRHSTLRRQVVDVALLAGTIVVLAILGYFFT